MARPKSFDPLPTLAAIRDCFWRYGYEGASLHRLEEATGLRKQSLYREFGDKRRMYLKALALYADVEVAQSAADLAQDGNAHRRFARLFHGVIDQLESTGDRSGCFLCNASLDQAQLDPESGRRIAAIFADLEQAFKVALQAEPEMARDPAKCAVLASALLATYCGIRVMVKAGAEVATLRAMADFALDAYLPRR